jgi:hypothetical protein
MRSGVCKHVIGYFEQHPDATLTPAQVREMFGVAEQTVRNKLSRAVREGKLGVLRRTRHNAPVYCRAAQPKDNGATLQAAWLGERHGPSNFSSRFALAA